MREMTDLEEIIQLTLRIPEEYDSKLRELGAQLVSNRQGAINYILNLYFTKELSQASAEELQ